MGSIRKYYARGRSPHGFWGKQALKSMNSAKHAALPEWVFAEIQVPKEARILDVGCGGGANIDRMLKLFPDCKVTGLDNSEFSLEFAKDFNYHAFVDKRCLFVGGNAVQMPLAKDRYDLVTAFETVYYWPSLLSGASELCRVLKPGGTCVIANELDGLEQSDKELEKRTGTMRVYTLDEIKVYMAEAGFINIESRHDEQRRFICVTGQKPEP